MFFSVVIPVYNRPEELADLLSSLVQQTEQEFEVIVMEDGSSITSKSVIDQYQNKLDIHYHFGENRGQGFARNDGMRLAKGDFFVILDSDVLLPKNYLELLKKAIQVRGLDAFGGPDAADRDFNSLQKAMDFAMTSFWTTGGIRGKLKDPTKYQARGFNMGVSRTVFESTKGFLDPNQGEDIEWSIRIKKEGFRLELVEEAFVYHKRKNTLVSFSKQAFSFGRNRVNVSRFHPDAIKLVHWLPSLFLIFLTSMVFTGLFELPVFHIQLLLLVGWSLAVLIESSIRYKSFSVGGLSLITSIIQLCSYGAGLLVEWVKKRIKG
ncbi:glycosyltransferase [Algoriphagus lutimaris]|uniref:glycosyltransferase n=1 Tax=Algoriphagus lutimaris TaxID=613197 RepID=UPI00196A2BA7|nr:glycosyltransferase [Algoriphagus lutimaris]MBN3522191.1 glycosyltransferase [Algoriphagus lutimaris]